MKVELPFINGSYINKLPFMVRRITIDSIGPAVAVTPFARWVNKMGLTAKVAPGPPSVRPFQAGQKGATVWPLNRALYGRNEKCAALKSK